MNALWVVLGILATGSLGYLAGYASGATDELLRRTKR